MIKNVKMDESKKSKMGLSGASILVAVNMMGTGIFLLPTSMAGIGGLSIWGWIVASIGAGAIGIMYAMLGAREPMAGGPYAYAREALGPYAGFQTNYVYWSGNLVGNVAVAATITGYFTVFFPEIKGNLAYTLFFNLIIIWAATVINIFGPKIVGYTAGIATVIGLIPVFIIASIGWFYFSPSTYIDGWNPSSMSVFEGISKSATFALWAYMGVETAAVASDSIKNPKRNVPLATILGFGASAIFYIVTCTVIMGIIPNAELKNSSDPFFLVIAKMFNPGMAYLLTICAILKVGSCLVGWTLVIAKSSQAAAGNGMFPKIYGLANEQGIPVWNLLISGVIMSAVATMTASSAISTQFNEIIDMAVILVLLAYMYTAVRFIRVFGGNKADFTKKLLAYFVGITACVYCLWAVWGSNDKQTAMALVFLLSSIPLYAIFEGNSARKRKHVKLGVR